MTSRAGRLGCLGQRPQARRIARPVGRGRGGSLCPPARPQERGHSITIRDEPPQLRFSGSPRRGVVTVKQLVNVATLHHRTPQTGRGSPQARMAEALMPWVARRVSPPVEPSIVRSCLIPPRQRPRSGVPSESVGRFDRASRKNRRTFPDRLGPSTHPATGTALSGPSAHPARPLAIRPRCGAHQPSAPRHRPLVTGSRHGPWAIRPPVRPVVLRPRCGLGHAVDSG
jgi:hypothetical protein